MRGLLGPAEIRDLAARLGVPFEIPTPKPDERPGEQPRGEVQHLGAELRDRGHVEALGDEADGPGPRADLDEALMAVSMEG